MMSHLTCVRGYIDVYTCMSRDNVSRDKGD